MAKVALGKTDKREIYYLQQLELKDQMIEEVKPTIWQHPIAIVSYVIVTAVGTYLLIK